jgi:hypothetical protein
MSVQATSTSKAISRHNPEEEEIETTCKTTGKAGPKVSRALQSGAGSLMPLPLFSFFPFLRPMTRTGARRYVVARFKARVVASALTSLPSRVESCCDVLGASTGMQDRLRSELIGADALRSGANPVVFNDAAIDMTVFQNFLLGCFSPPSLKYAKVVPGEDSKVIP